MILTATMAQKKMHKVLQILCAPPRVVLGLSQLRVVRHGEGETTEAILLVQRLLRFARNDGNRLTKKTTHE